MCFTRYSLDEYNKEHKMFTMTLEKYNFKISMLHVKFTLLPFSPSFSLAPLTPFLFLSLSHKQHIYIYIYIYTLKYYYNNIKILKMLIQIFSICSVVGFTHHSTLIMLMYSPVSFSLLLITTKRFCSNQK